MLGKGAEGEPGPLVPPSSSADITSLLPQLGGLDGGLSR